MVGLLGGIEDILKKGRDESSSAETLISTCATGTVNISSEGNVLMLEDYLRTGISIAIACFSLSLVCTFFSIRLHFKRNSDLEDEEAEVELETKERVAADPISPSSCSYYDGRTPVWFSMRCNLESIDLVAQTFSCDLWLNFFWAPPQDFWAPPQDLWAENSAITWIDEKRGLLNIEDDGENMPINIGELFENALVTEVLSGPVFQFNSKSKSIRLSIHVHAVFEEEMELGRFPFDRQFLTMRVCFRSKEYSVMKCCPDFVPNKLNMRQLVTHTFSPVVGKEYKVITPVVGMCCPLGQSEDKRVAVSLRVEREFFYWIFNFLLEVFFIVLLSAVTFAVEQDQIVERMGIVLSLLLTLVTFKSNVANVMPASTEFKYIDVYISLSYLILLGVVGQSVGTLLFVPDEFWAVLNYFSGLGLVFFWSLLHVWIIYMAFTGGLHVKWADMKDEATDNPGGRKEKVLRARTQDINFD